MVWYGKQSKIQEYQNKRSGGNWQADGNVCSQLIQGSPQEKNIEIPVAVGGAVVTQSFADKIGASLYAKDALEAVKKVKDFLKI